MNRLESLLAAGGRRWPASVDVLEAVGSTNDELKERARAGAREWTALLARQQSAGRGRHGRTWVSAPGNLFLSVLLRPGGGATLIPLLAGVAVAEALSSRFAAAVLLKWPNDLWVGSKKLGGILAEGMSSGSGLEGVVVGIGVNLSSAPEGATSILQETGKTADPEQVAAEVLPRLALWYDRFRVEPGAIAAAWRSLALPWWGKDVEVSSGERILRGVARDIDPEGALLLEDGQGGVERVLSGEARLLGLQGVE